MYIHLLSFVKFTISRVFKAIHPEDPSSAPRHNPLHSAAPLPPHTLQPPSSIKLKPQVPLNSRKALTWSWQQWLHLRSWRALWLKTAPLVGNGPTPTLNVVCRLWPNQSHSNRRNLPRLHIRHMVRRASAIRLHPCCRDQTEWQYDDMIITFCRLQTLHQVVG